MTQQDNQEIWKAISLLREQKAMLEAEVKTLAEDKKNFLLDKRAIMSVQTSVRVQIGVTVAMMLLMVWMKYH